MLVCPQGVDIQIFYPSEIVKCVALRKQYGIEKDCFLILSVGFVIHRKGILDTVNVIATLEYDLNYYVIGEYEFAKHHLLFHEYNDARQIVTEGKNKLGSKLVFTGHQDHLEDYYNMADLVIINSDREGLPNTLLEAMACGCAVLCRDLPGLKGYILDHKKNGILFSTQNEMRDWIIRLYNDEKHRRNLGKNAVETIRQKGTFDVTWKNITTALYGKT